MSIVVAIGLLTLFLIIISRKEAFLLKSSTGVVILALLIVTFLSVNRKDDIFLQIPGTRIENSAVFEVSNSGSMYLDSSQSVYIDNKFFMSDDGFDDLSDWLEETQKAVHLYIVDGSKTLYHRNLGLYEDGMEASVRSIYRSWKNDGVVPADAIRYWFLIFYLEV